MGKYQTRQSWTRRIGSLAIAVGSATAGVAVAFPPAAPLLVPIGSIAAGIGIIARCLAFDWPRDRWTDEERKQHAMEDDTPPKGTQKP